MGSPTSTVLLDRLGSLSVHCRSIPAGRTTLRALASWLEKTTRPSMHTRAAERTWDFILHLGRFASESGGLRYRPALVCFAHLITVSGYRSIRICLEEKRRGGHRETRARGIVEKLRYWGSPG